MTTWTNIKLTADQIASIDRQMFDILNQIRDRFLAIEAQLDGDISLENLFFSGEVTGLNAAGPTLLNEAATSTNPTIMPNKADPDTGIGWAAANKISIIAGGSESMRFEAASGQTQFYSDIYIGTNAQERDININGPAAASRSLYIKTASVKRWELRGNLTAEGGANAGTDLELRSFADDGSYISTPLTVTRSTGDITLSGGAKSTSPTAGIGYATGAGGAVTQVTSKATAVTLNTICGQITMHNASLAGNTTVVTFVCTNSASTDKDVVIINHVAGGTMGDYVLNGHCENGHVDFHLTNVSHAPLSEAVVLQFAIIKAVTA